MKGVILAVDLGATITDIVRFENGEVVQHLFVPSIPLEELEKLLLSSDIEMRNVDGIAVTGGRSSYLRARLCGIPTYVVPELEAIARGGLFLAAKRKALVASVGTGTCIVHASWGRRFFFSHILGTGVGGGTLAGLGKILAGTNDVRKLQALAERGRLHKANLTVGDILGEGLAGLPPHATASNFGKLVSVRSISKEDFCAALFSMVCETNAVLFSLASKAFDSEKVIAVGRVPSIPYFAKHLNQAARMLGFELIIPKNPELATAVGAALAVEARNKTRF